MKPHDESTTTLKSHTWRSWKTLNSLLEGIQLIDFNFRYVRLSGQVTSSGIGLYIVRETINKLQGLISLSSQEVIGSTFNITLKNPVVNYSKMTPDKF